MLLAIFLMLLTYLLPISGLALVYYFAIYLPAVLENDEKILLWHSLKVGDRVVTTGGLVGFVFQKKEQFVILTIFDGSLVEVTLVSICEKL